MLNRQQNES